MKRALLALAVLAGFAAATPLVKRESIGLVEAGFKQKLQESEMEILALPRGIYVAGFGVVFTADASLCYTPIINPFQLKISDEVQTKIYQKKVKQVPVLRTDMQQILMMSSALLDTLPMSEQIVVGVTIGTQKWETTAGLPSQIIMQGQRAKLLEARSGRVAIDSVIKVQEQ
jgi:hypothetical protein